MPPILEFVSTRAICTHLSSKTTAHLTQRLFSFLLVRHPKVLRRLQDEIESVMGSDAEITRLHIQKMSYLKCILNESMYYLRLVPLLDLTWNHAINSSTAVSSDPYQRSLRTENDMATSRGWSRWSLASPCASWHGRGLRSVLHASAERSIWRRRYGLSS